ncbi:MAG TPA: M56 family metallopeptidase [Mycobacterium sp.]|nr:M56 family metallopeptidase [Mycobacterium sp.]
MAAHQLLFAALVTVAAPAVLGRAGWVHRSPRLGIAAWYSALAAVLSGVGAATAALLAPWRRADAPVCVAWRWCLQAVRGDYGVTGRMAAAAVVAVTAVMLIRLLVCGVRFTRRQSAHRRQHLQLLRLAGRESPELGATVLDCAQPAAYMVAGHGRRVVVTTGAVATLRDEELAAVLAHERAHATGRHDLLLNGVRLLRSAFPRLPLFVTAWHELCRLVELRADEVAATQHQPLNLARALVAMAGASSPEAPAGSVAATGGDAATRLRRLLSPPQRLSGAQQGLIGTGVAVVAVTPTLALAASWMFPTVATCLLLPL